MSLLKQDIVRKKNIDKNNATELDASQNEIRKYKVGPIWDSTVYIKKLADYLSKVYYLIFWKNYLEEENT